MIKPLIIKKPIMEGNTTQAVKNLMNWIIGKRNPKMTKEIESVAIDRWESLGWKQAKEYLVGVGFSLENIELMREKWSEGKSFYPYK